MHTDKVRILQDRAQMLARARAFFAGRGVVEVDCPALSRSAPIDVHIEVMPVSLLGGEVGYLHTSPEYGMKRLLAAGMGAIYQISHVFRNGEIGPLHNPEFTLVEWYRELSFDLFIEETLAFIRLFLQDLPSERIGYREALLRYAGIDYLSASLDDLLACVQKHEIHPEQRSGAWDRETLLHLLMSFVVEPHLGKGALSVLTDYPATQAALAQTHWKGEEQVAERFEIYYQGIELTNGYHELTDPVEQKRRLEEANQTRRSQGKEPLPLDEHFLAALEEGLPDCCGVAVGFDRLMLLRHNKTSLEDVLPFAWHMS